MWYQKTYTEEDFTSNRDVIHANGGWSPDQKKFNINTSSILTRLIQEAGRWCESYASDLFISLNIVERELANNRDRTEKYLFGFRKSGVDHKEWVIHRYNEHEHHEYRTVWILDIVVNDDEMTMNLSRYY